jgi:uncharacterized protein YkwD
MTYASSWQDYAFVGTPAEAFPAFRKVLTGIHDHFIPHERNNYHPHILGQRLLGLFSLLMVALKFATLASLAFGPSSMAYSSAISVDNVFSLTNGSRTAYELPALTINNKLSSAAQNKADDMAAKGYFAHTTPDGHSPWWFIQNTGYSYITAGENLAVDFTQAENVETAWMNSPGHRANILNKNFEQIGIGIASGQFQGHETTFVVQMFGTPADQPIAFQSKPTVVAPAPAAPAPAPAPVSHSAVVPAPAPASVAPAAKPPAAVIPSPAVVAVPPIATKVAAITPRSSDSAPAPAAVAAAETPEPITASASPSAVQIIDTSTSIQGDQLLVSVTTSGPAVKVMADFKGAGALLYPKSDTLWQGVIPLASLHGETNLTVIAADMQGGSRQAGVASFTPSLQSNYQFLGAVKGATVNVLGTLIDPKVFEQKFYLVMIATLLACMVLAIAVKRHIQHLSLVANSSFVVVLATLLWMAH